MRRKIDTSQPRYATRGVERRGTERKASEGRTEEREREREGISIIRSVGR